MTSVVIFRVSFLTLILNLLLLLVQISNLQRGGHTCGVRKQEGCIMMMQSVLEKPQIMITDSSDRRTSEGWPRTSVMGQQGQLDDSTLTGRTNVKWIWSCDLPALLWWHPLAFCLLWYEESEGTSEKCPFLDPPEGRWVDTIRKLKLPTTPQTNSWSQFYSPGNTTVSLHSKMWNKLTGS